jgi:ADP-dependent NAD(P)H-hydrate dehydratase / NAD(P)H-hydrate epimerase
MAMRPVLPPSVRCPLFGNGATRAIEQRCTGELPAHTLMRRAGEAVARLALALAPHARCVWIAAGPGNNGGDGFEAAVQLQLRGKQVRVTLAADTQHMPSDASDALARAQAAGVRIEAAGWPELDAQDIAIDALLGIGASRAPQGPIAALIARLNAQPCAVLAVDVPSGMNANTGQPIGDCCVVAQHTLSLLTLKPGLFTGAGRDHAGTVWLDALGVRTDADAPDAWLAGQQDLESMQPRRRHAQHKGSFGDVAVVGGTPGMTGAALLAARAAHAAGAGRVFVNLLDKGSMTHDLLRPELMFRPDWSAGAPTVLACATVVCGCGGGEAVRELLPRLLSRAGRLVLDADALNAVASDSVLQTLLTARRDAGRSTVLTPHPLEAARLLNVPTAQVQSDRMDAAIHLARRFGCVVLLKGSGTVIAAPDCVPSINPTGNAALASAGTGDVLAGWLGGLWAQAADAAPASTAFQAAVAAAFMHGAAADQVANAPLRAADLIEAMHAARGF